MNFLYQIKGDHPTNSNCHYKYLIFEKRPEIQAYQLPLNAFGGSWGPTKINRIY